MELLAAAPLALFLSIPVGPIGIAAGERLLLGGRSDFLWIALGCVLADVAWAVFAVGLTLLVPSFDVAWLYHMWQPWAVIGLTVTVFGVYMLYYKPAFVGESIRRHPLAFGFVGTILWPTTAAGIVGTFVGAQFLGAMPSDTSHRVLVAMGLGVGTTAMWFVWWCGFSALRWARNRLQKEWLSVVHVARFFHFAVAGALILGGIGIMLYPFLEGESLLHVVLTFFA